MNREARHAARLAAVQALYQLDQVEDLTPDHVIEEFLKHRLHQAADETQEIKIDETLFKEIIQTAGRRPGDINRSISDALTEGWTLDRLEAVLAAILRAGCAEFLMETKTPAAVIINEYIKVTHEFYSGKEAGFVNGILDHIARKFGLDMKGKACEVNANELQEAQQISGVGNWEQEGGNFKEKSKV